jgi:hypothetical protein
MVRQRTKNKSTEPVVPFSEWEASIVVEEGQPLWESRGFGRGTLACSSVYMVWCGFLRSGTSNIAGARVTIWAIASLSRESSCSAVT